MQITVIGGAGVRTVIFINGLLERYKTLNIDKVVLYDIDQKKQEIIAKLCRHVVSRKNKDLIIQVADEAVDAIKGADYVVTTLRVGGDHSRVIDETVALEKGVIGQETTGVGGFSMAVRTLPVLVEYCEMIRTYAPDAWIFNFTNPSGLVTQALRGKGYDKVIGICDAPSSTKFRMAKQLDIEEKDLYVEFFGLNHLSWIQSVRVGEEELIGKLLNDNTFLQEIQEFSMFDKALLQQLGLLPNEYLYYYYHREKALENILSSGATRGKTIEQVNEAMIKELQVMDIERSPEEALQIFLYYMEVRERSYMAIETGNQKEQSICRGELEVPDGMGYAGVMLDCIEGLQSEEGKHLVLSVVNKGCITDLNDEDVIEVTCKVSRNGIHPVPIGQLPEHCAVLVKSIKHYEKLTIEAIFEKSREKAIQALTLHPLVNSYSLAKELVEAYETAYDRLF